MNGLSEAKQRAVFERDGYMCRGCKRKLPCVLDIPPSRRQGNVCDFLVVDHVNNRSNESSNLQSLCWACNSAKAGKGDYAFKLSAALKQLGRCMTYYPCLARLIGLKESIFLCQILYWSPRGRNTRGEGWIYKSAEEMEEETGLSYKEQLRLRGALVRQQLLEEKYDRTSHRMFFRVCTEALDSLGYVLHKPAAIHSGHMTNGNVPPAQKEIGTLPNVKSYKEAKITTKITTEKPVGSCKWNRCDGSGWRNSISRPGVKVLCECQDPDVEAETNSQEMQRLWK